jgi:hypothetical protein
MIKSLLRIRIKQAYRNLFGIGVVRLFFLIAIAIFNAIRI